MIRALFGLTACLLLVPHPAAAFSCRYPPRHLSGVAELGEGKVVRLDFDIEDFGGAECEVDIRGRGRCQPVGHRTFGVEFALPGKCPSETFTISEASYVRRTDERIADVILDIEFKNGDRCHITGVSPALYFNSRAFGGPLPSLSGQIVCPTNISPGVAEFFERR
jgi:hypothetical protein